jgi:Bacterial dipeptidyl-peptidase Sh3 domain
MSKAARCMSASAPPICAGTTDLLHAPAPDASLDTQALFGEDVMLYEDHEGWGWVQLSRDGFGGTRKIYHPNL